MFGFISKKQHEYEIYKVRTRNEMSELQEKLWELEAKLDKIENKLEESGK